MNPMDDFTNEAIHYATQNYRNIRDDVVNMLHVLSELDLINWTLNTINNQQNAYAFENEPNYALVRNHPLIVLCNMNNVQLSVCFIECYFCLRQPIR
jgi:hypothetical protein